MDPVPPPHRLSRRDFVRMTSALAATALAGRFADRAVAAEPVIVPSAGGPATVPSWRPLLTKADDFADVSRGKPKPFTLTGDALIEARLTPETWRLEIVADPFTSAEV